MRVRNRIAIGAVALLAVGAGTFRYLRGPSGGSSAYGGSIAADLVPDFPKAGATAWANGAPTSLAALRGAPVILEIWSPT